MQSGLIESTNHSIETADIPTYPPHTTQHGSGHSRSDLPGAGSPLRSRGSSSDAPRCAGESATGLLRADHGAETPDRLSCAEINTAIDAQVVPAGHRIAEYERAAVSASPRSSRVAPGFKATATLSQGVQLMDLPNGASFAAAPPPGRQVADVRML